MAARCLYSFMFGFFFSRLFFRVAARQHLSRSMRPAVVRPSLFAQKAGRNRPVNGFSSVAVSPGIVATRAERQIDCSTAFLDRLPSRRLLRDSLTPTHASLVPQVTACLRRFFEYPFKERSILHSFFARLLLVAAAAFECHCTALIHLYLGHSARYRIGCFDVVCSWWASIRASIDVTTRGEEMRPRGLFSAICTGVLQRRRSSSWKPVPMLRSVVSVTGLSMLGRLLKDPSFERVPQLTRPRRCFELSPGDVRPAGRSTSIL